MQLYGMRPVARKQRCTQTEGMVKRKKRGSALRKRHYSTGIGASLCPGVCASRIAREGSAGGLARVLRAPQPPGSSHLGRLLLDGKTYPCALGRAGITGVKCEGDGATPRGALPILAGRYRADRVVKPSMHSSFWTRIKTHDGWCDAPFTPAYNYPVSRPHRHSHEVMAREDGLYDRLIILDWNFRRRHQARGSAIFLHQARIESGGMKPTEGCIALPATVFARLAPRLVQLDAIRVV